MARAAMQRAKESDNVGDGSQAPAASKCTCTFLRPITAPEESFWTAVDRVAFRTPPHQFHLMRTSNLGYQYP